MSFLKVFTAKKHFENLIFIKKRVPKAPEPSAVHQSIHYFVGLWKFLSIL